MGRMCCAYIIFVGTNDRKTDGPSLGIDKRQMDRQWRTQEFCSGGGGFQQIQLRTEGRENGDLGAVAPLVRGSTQFANEQNLYSY
jgi:hypothetical protein